MTVMFGQVLTALQGFFSRGFWFGAFLPIAIFCALNELIGDLSLGDPLRQPFVTVLTNIQTQTWFWATPAAIAMIVLAYAVAPLGPAFRAILDGRLLPNDLFERFCAEPLKKKDQVDESLRKAENSLSVIKLLAGNDLAGIPSLARDLLDKAVADAPNVPVAATLTGARDTAYRGVARVQSRLRRKLTVDGDDLLAMFGNVAEALRQNTVSQAEIGDFTSRALSVLPGARSLAEALVRRRKEDKETWPDEVKATRIANTRQKSEIYSQQAYGADFSYLWPRVQMVIPDKDPVLDQIQAARALLDFSVLSMMLTSFLIVIWLPVLAFKATNPWGFLVIGCVGPVAMMFYYRIVIAAQAGLGDLAQVIIDRFRFEVLKMLHIKPPPTLAEERKLWLLLGLAAHRPVAEDSPPADTDLPLVTPK